MVEAIGAGVTEFALDEPVLGTLRSAPGDWATRGSLITRLVAPASDVVRKPEAIAFDVAGALGVAAQTACGALRALQVGAGDVVVISGASGSVGSLATQLAVLRGATVIGIGGESNAGYLREFGQRRSATGATLGRRSARPCPGQPRSSSTALAGTT